MKHFISTLLIVILFQIKKKETVRIETKLNCMRKLLRLLLIIFFTNANLSFGQPAATFTNPLLPSGADPWCIYKDGYYYYTHTTGSNITIWKTASIADLANAEKKVVFMPPQSGPYAKELWAPEIHYIDNKWYIYFAADSGNNRSHRLWVIENVSADPMMGEWMMKGKLKTPGDKWSIDGSIFTTKGKMYLIWSGWEGDYNGRQVIYIAKMKNPWTVRGKRVMISKPELAWEKYGDLNNPQDVPHVDVNEGPEVLHKGKNLFLVYSASGCWTDFYSLGMLTIKSRRNVMRARNWKKSPSPVFTQYPENSVFAPGHNSFFKSPDGKEDWILYHANNLPRQGCGKFRSPRAQQFKWKDDGTPDFGVPLPTGTTLSVPTVILKN